MSTATATIRARNFSAWKLKEEDERNEANIFWKRDFNEPFLDLPACMDVNVMIVKQIGRYTHKISHFKLGTLTPRSLFDDE